MPFFHSSSSSSSLFLSLLLLLIISTSSTSAFLLPSIPTHPHTRTPSIHPRIRAIFSSSPSGGGQEVPFPADAGDVTLEPSLASNPDRFIVDISVWEPTAAELEETNLVKIVKLQCTDQEVNFLAWKCLGYRYIATEGRWDSSKVFPKWAARYPEPPDLVNVQRIYEKEIDAPIKKANTALVRSVPKMYKQSLKELLAPYGFKGFKIAELTPNRTRRAQVCNWLLYYKRDLWGIDLEELLKKKTEVTQVTREGETPEQLGNKMVY